MPYIKQEDKELLGDVYVGQPAKTAGDLNYKITELVLAFLPKQPRYADYNAAIGALEACKLEFYRRAVAPYENQKAFDNGDVYDPDPDLSKGWKEVEIQQTISAEKVAEFMNDDV